MKISNEEFAAIKNSKPVNRRTIYKLLDFEGKDTGRYVLVIIGSHRNNDNYVSVIKLTQPDMDNGNHRDEIGLQLPNGMNFWVHCGMITYIRRSQCGEKLHQVSKNSMKRINRCIQQELGLIDKPGVYSAEEPYEPDYKQLYEDLLDAVAKGVTR